jgi:hypothetical protein
MISTIKLTKEQLLFILKAKFGKSKFGLKIEVTNCGDEWLDDCVIVKEDASGKFYLFNRYTFECYAKNNVPYLKSLKDSDVIIDLELREVSQVKVVKTIWELVNTPASPPAGAKKKSIPKKLRSIRDLTREERKSIYDYAMERSKEILNGYGYYDY